jgi:hypothetical protein
MTGLGLAFSTVSEPPRPGGRGRLDRLAGLRVFVVGLESHVSRDTVRYLVAHKARATVLGEDHDVDLLRRDLELARIIADLAPVETMNPAELRLVAENLRELGGLPHLIACCCTRTACPLALIAPVMQPPLMLHVVSTGGGWLGAACARSLPSLLVRDDLLNPAVALPRVRLGRHLFEVRRRERRPPGRPAAIGEHLVCVADNTAKPARG